MNTMNELKQELRKRLTPIQVYCNSQNYNNEKTLNTIIEAVANWHLEKIEQRKEVHSNQKGLF